MTWPLSYDRGKNRNFLSKKRRLRQSQLDVSSFSSPKILGFIPRPRDHKKLREWCWFDLLIALSTSLVLPGKSAFRNHLTSRTFISLVIYRV